MENEVSGIDPRIVQGLLTFFAALIASATALIVAFAAYPRQKKIDRLNEALGERREIYREFVCAVESTEHALLVYRSTGAGEKLMASNETMSTALGKIYVSAPDVVASLAKETSFELAEWVRVSAAEYNEKATSAEKPSEQSIVLYKKYLRKMDGLVVEMRKETYPNTSVVDLNLLNSVLLDVTQAMLGIGRISR